MCAGTNTKTAGAGATSGEGDEEQPDARAMGEIIASALASRAASTELPCAELDADSYYFRAVI